MPESLSVAPKSQEKSVYSVSQLNREARTLLEKHFPQVWIEGEISNFSRPASGHWYFTLKDEQAQVRCAMFRARNQALALRPKDGMRVLVRAQISLFEGRGEFQLLVEYMEESGEGALQRAFEALKRKLQAEGLFDSERKRPIPVWPQRVGVITSGSGAAIRDILSTLQRRWPALPVCVYPVPVQGAEAAPAIIAALQTAGARATEDVLILARGGGSMEDLWAFNDEALVRAICACPIPIISGVGHEVDFTLSDFAADLRAPTPTAAAELVSPQIQEWRPRVRELERRLVQHMQRRLSNHGQMVDMLQQRLLHPGKRIEHMRERVDGLRQRLLLQMMRSLEQKQLLRQRTADGLLRCNPVARRLPLLRQRLAQQEAKLLQQGKLQVSQRQEILYQQLRQLNLVSPLNVIERGYAIVSSTQGKIIQDSRQTRPGQAVRVRLARGELRCRVEESQSGLSFSPEEED